MLAMEELVAARYQGENTRRVWEELNDTHVSIVAVLKFPTMYRFSTACLHAHFVQLPLKSSFSLL